MLFECFEVGPANIARGVTLCIGNIWFCVDVGDKQAGGLFWGHGISFMPFSISMFPLCSPFYLYGAHPIVHTHKNCSVELMGFVFCVRAHFCDCPNILFMMRMNSSMLL